MFDEIKKAFETLAKYSYAFGGGNNAPSSIYLMDREDFDAIPIEATSEEITDYIYLKKVYDGVEYLFFGGFGSKKEGAA